MSQLSSSADTVKVLGTTGLQGTDTIGHKLYLFHQLNAKIISIKANTYYIEGDVTEFLSGYNYFWVCNRSANDKNVINKVSATYDIDKLWTKLVVGSTAIDSSDYNVNENDIGSFVCGRYDLTPILKDIGVAQQQITGDSSFTESIAAKINIVINDENRVFYDKINKSGYFYTKEIMTDVIAVSARSIYSHQSGVYTTFIKAKDLTKDYIGGNFINGYMEFLTGEAIGEKAVIIDANGNSFNVLGHYAIELSNVSEYKKNVKKYDKIRIYKADTFWFRLDIWHRDYLDEKVYVICGKIDLDEVTVNDNERLVYVNGYSTIKDLMTKNIGDLSFDSGLNLPRLTELKAIYLDKCSNRAAKIVQRIEADPNPLASVTVSQVAFDVDPGWHIFDYNPEGQLFRFDLGKWYQAIDEGSFEKSTQSIFMLAMEEWRYNNPAVLPDHTLESNTMEENIQIEQQWHGGWCAFTVELEEEQFIGAVGTQRMKDATGIWKKFAGLPKEPCRMLFYVDSDHKIAHQVVFAYSYDNGEQKVPDLFFDYIYYDALFHGDDMTYDLGFGALSYRKTVELPFSYNYMVANRHLDLCSFDKVNGILMRFKNDNTMNFPYNEWQSVSHNAVLAKALESLRFQFSGVNVNTAINGNVSSRYVNGYCTDVPGGSREFTLEIYKNLHNMGIPDKSYYEDIVNKNMWMMSISGKNFGQLRKIKSVKLDNPQDFSLLKIVLESGFDNIIEQYDRFTIINKQNEIRFIDIGDNMKDGEVPDIIARYSDDLTIGHYYDIKRQKMNNLVYDEIIRPNDYIYIGHRHRFNSAIVAIDINTASDYYWKIAWYLRRDFYDVEYWNGSSWSKVTDLTMIPTSVVNERDTAGTQIEKDDIIKYRMLFDAPDWQCGGYDANDYNSGESPSNIEEDKMYLIRVKLTISIPVYLKYVSLADRMELNLAVIWEDMPEWGRNEISIESGKYIVDTLTYDFLTLNMYRIRVTANENFYAAMIMCRPITKLKGSLGDNLYVVADPSNIDINIDKDVIIYDKNKINNISVMPVNASYSYLIGKILDDCNLVLGHKTKLSADHNNDISRNIVNPIGSGYDGVYPVDVGWEKVVVTEKITHNIVGEYRHICVIRDAGVYRAFCVTRDGTEVHMWTSDDMITWANQGNIVTNIGTKIIHAVDVVKNKDDSKYAFYITAK